MRRRFCNALVGLWVRRHLYPDSVLEIVDNAIRFGEGQLEVNQRDHTPEEQSVAGQQCTKDSRSSLPAPTAST